MIHQTIAGLGISVSIILTALLVVSAVLFCFRNSANVTGKEVEKKDDGDSDIITRNGELAGFFVPFFIVPVFFSCAILNRYR